MVNCLLGLVVWLSCANGVQAQTLFDPYNKLNDPYAISEFGRPDSRPFIDQGDNSLAVPKDTEGYAILASGVGPGVLTHIWVTYANGGDPDSTGILKLWIDDSLAKQGDELTFFTEDKGQFRAPFDTILSGGFVVDAQTLFKNSFRLTYNGKYMIYHAAYRQLAAGTTFPPADSLETMQRSAEAQYYLGRPSYPSGSDSTTIFVNLSAHDSSLVFEKGGPGVIESLTVDAKAISSEALKAIRIKLFWDKSPMPAIDVPLADFFGCGAGYQAIRSYCIHARDSVLSSFFPMPFRHQAQIRLVNEGGVAVTVPMVVTYRARPISDSTGYFGAQFHESNPTKRNKLHPTLLARGKGRFVGSFIMLPKRTSPSYMEGNVFIDVDSAQQHSFYYFGIEDYCSAGWYFNDGPISKPFMGSPDSLWSCLYRFHILDAVDFNRNVSVHWDHGFKSDLKTHYRTVAYYYMLPEALWSSRDTVRPHEVLRVGGSRFQPFESVTASFAGATVTGSADGQGLCQLWINVPDVPSGTYPLFLNGGRYSTDIAVLTSPILRMSQDSIPFVIYWRDSVEVSGVGFQPGEAVSFSLENAVTGSITTFPTTPALVDSTYSFRARVLIPYCETSDYRIVALTSTDTATTDFLLRVWPRSNYEFEELPVVSGAERSGSNYLGFLRQIWSNQTIMFSNNTPVDSVIAYSFDVARQDTFALSIFGTYGNRFGTYEVLLDGERLGSIDHFRDWPWGTVDRSDQFRVPSIAIDSGRHVIAFRCLGKDQRALESSLGLDNMTLDPIRLMHLSRPSPQDRKHDVLSMFPNPLRGNVLHVALPVETLAKAITITDALGRSVVRDVLGTANEATIVLPELSPGVYNVRAGDVSAKLVIRR